MNKVLLKPIAELCKLAIFLFRMTVKICNLKTSCTHEASDNLSKISS